eukprot:2508091-Rhodomonas_salina.1
MLFRHSRLGNVLTWLAATLESWSLSSPAARRINWYHMRPVSTEELVPGHVKLVLACDVSTRVLYRDGTWAGSRVQYRFAEACAQALGVGRHARGVALDEDVERRDLRHVTHKHT